MTREAGLRIETDEDGAPFEMETVIGYHLRRATVRALADFSKAMGDEIKPVPFTVLNFIDGAPGITAAQIGRRSGLQRANLAPMLAELEGQGLIERRPDREDHRVHRLHVSADGAAALEGWRARVAAAEELTFAGLTQSERRTLRELLAKVWDRR